jgi:8-oxo-dGTP diphosphatase
MSWQLPGAFDVTPLLPANTVILRALELPSAYGISMAAELGDDEFLRRARVAIDNGLRLIQLREKTMPHARLALLAEALLEIARPSGTRVLLNGDVESARELGCAGVHWTAAALAAATERPADLLCAASCHDARELAIAAQLGVDLAVLGPVCPTPLHGPAMGWQRFEALARTAGIPVYALGGLHRSDLDVALDHAAHGLALRRAAWEPQKQPAHERSGSALSASSGSSTTGTR